MKYAWCAAALLVTSAQISFSEEPTQVLAGSGSAERGFADGSFADARFSRPTDVVPSPDGKVLYVADVDNDRVRLLDLVRGEVRTLAGPEWEFEGKPHRWQAGFHLALDSQGGCLLVSGQPLVAIDLETGKPRVAFTPKVGAGAMALDPKRRVLYFDDMEPNRNLYDRISRIQELDLATGEIRNVAGDKQGEADGVGEAAQFGSIFDLALSPDGQVLYASEYAYGLGHDRVRRIDLETRSVTTVIETSIGRAIQVSADGLALYTASSYGWIAWSTARSGVEIGRLQTDVALDGLREGPSSSEAYAVSESKQCVLRVKLPSIPSAVGIIGVRAKLTSTAPGSQAGAELSFVTSLSQGLAAGKDEVTLDLRRAGVRVQGGEVTCRLEGVGSKDVATRVDDDGRVMRFTVPFDVPPDGRVEVEIPSPRLTCQMEQEGARRILVSTTSHASAGRSNAWSIGAWRSGLDRFEGEADDLLSDVMPDIPLQTPTADEFEVDPPTGLGISKTTIAVVFRGDATLGQANGVLAKVEGRVIGAMPMGGFVTIAIPDKGVEHAMEAVRTLEADPCIEMAMPDMAMPIGPDDEN